MLDLEDKVQKLSEKLDSKADKVTVDKLSDLINKIMGDIEKLYDATSSNKSEIDSLKQTMELIESKLSELYKELGRLKTSIVKSSSGIPSSGMTIDPEEPCFSPSQFLCFFTKNRRGSIDCTICY